MSNEALKPCPFCGGKPYLDLREKELGNLWEIGCGNRRCKMAVYLKDIQEKKKAIVAWNKRVKVEEK